MQARTSSSVEISFFRSFSWASVIVSAESMVVCTLQPTTYHLQPMHLSMRRRCLNLSSADRERARGEEGVGSGARWTEKIVAQDAREADDLCGRLHVVGGNLLQHVDEREDGADLLRVCFHFFLAEPQPRELGNVTNAVGRELSHSLNQDSSRRTQWPLQGGR